MKETLKYELERLENLVNALLTGKESAWKSDDDLSTENHFEGEEAIIKKNLVREVFAFNDERHLERYIQFHQQQLIQLADNLNSVSQGHPKINGILHQQAVASIESLLEFIERHFTRYFDQDTKAPENYIVLCGSDVVKNFGSLRESLQRLNIEEHVMDLLLHPACKFMDNISAGRITYRNIIYVREVLKEINSMIAKADQDAVDHIHQLLLYLNYNTLKYFHYFTNRIDHDVQQAESVGERIEKLSYHRKVIHQVQVKPDVGYNRNVPTLKEQLSVWIEEEILYLEKSTHSSGGETPRGQVTDQFKIKTELSVAQLACLVRVMLESKCILNQNTSELMRFFSRHVQTKRLENISYESFRVRFYNIEDGTRRGVRNLLLQWVDFMNKI